MEQAQIEHAPNGRLLTYITSADDALVNNIVITHKNYLIAGEIVGSVYFYEYVPYVMIHKKKSCT